MTAEELRTDTRCRICKRMTPAVLCQQCWSWFCDDCRPRHRCVT